MGKKLAIWASTELFLIAPKVPEMNSSGNRMKLMIAGAASSLGTKVETAVPRALKQKPAAATVTTSPR